MITKGKLISVTFYVTQTVSGIHISIHGNLRTLAVELFKVFKGLGPVIFVEAFPVRQQSQYSMTNYSYFVMPFAKRSTMD